MARGERRYAADVVRMFVGDDDGIERIGFDADAGQARGGIAHAEPAVDHDARGAGFDNESVALAAAADRREAHYAFRIT